MTTGKGFQTVLVSQADGVAEITMNRPEKMNALNPQLQRELADAIQQSEDDAAVRVIILTGAGRAFTAGIDLRDMGASLGMENDPSSGRRVFDVMESAATPIIGAVNGFTVTGGFEIALACDILIASTEARFADTHALIGVIPGAGLSQKLSRIVGTPRAMAMSLTGEYITAEQAYQFGLVSHLVSPEELMPTARRLARSIADAHTETVLEVKALIKSGARETLGTAMKLESDAHAQWKREHTADSAESRRESVMSRGRSQN